MPGSRKLLVVLALTHATSPLVLGIWYWCSPAHDTRLSALIARGALFVLCSQWVAWQSVRAFIRSRDAFQDQETAVLLNRLQTLARDLANLNSRLERAGRGKSAADSLAVPALHSRN